MKKAIYAFSGDPITHGHIDIISRAAKVFDQIIVAIGSNPMKKHLFSKDERLKMATEALSCFPNVTVTSFTGLLADFAYGEGIFVIIRGLRNSEDFNFELMLHHVGESQNKDLETFLIPCHKQLSHISSGAVKAIQLEQGSVLEYVPINVKPMLEERISGQIIIGVTGVAGSGKTYLCEQCVKEKTNTAIDVHHIDTDTLGKKVILNANVELKQKLCSLLNIDYNTYSLSSVSEIMFDNKERLQLLNEILRPYVLYEIRKAIYGRKGVILLESALFAELNMLSLCNNRILLIDTSLNHIYERGHSNERIASIVSSQYTVEKKKEIIEHQIETDRFGQMICVKDRVLTLDEIMAELKIKYFITEK